MRTTDMLEKVALNQHQI